MNRPPDPGHGPPVGVLPRPNSVVAVAAFLLAPAGVAAQVSQFHVDLNGSRIRYDTLDALNAPSLATSLEWTGRALVARLGGSFTGFEENGESLQGRGEVAGWFSPAGPGSPLRVEVSGGGGGSRHSSGFDSWVGQGDVRAYYQAGNSGAWAGVGLAAARNSFDSVAVTSVAPNAGAWTRVGPTRLVARYTDTRLDGERFPELHASAVYSTGSLDVTAFAGWRASPFEGQDADAWLGASAAYWVAPRLAVLVSAGDYAPDVLQGIPGGSFVSLGVRFAPRRRRPVAPDAPLPLLFTQEAARTGGVGFHVPDARVVEVAGDWNEWQPEPLERSEDGRWVLPVDLEPGVYRFNLRVDGTRWIVPEGIPTVDDGFGGEVGLLVISESQ